MEWLIAWLVSRLMGTGVLIEVRGADGFRFNAVATGVAYRNVAGANRLVVVYDEARRDAKRTELAAPQSPTIVP